ncbi:hypothetical protein [Aeromonas sp. DNRA1]|uniref:hypothetical protein n=1 Tax=Aeromonas sp. DNRA1 TaxID=2729335 RepID=UPI001459816D|nr:hypothetical protein [Aeromonas sp. DNRA1]NME02459.1 hypothetical protein [Aeromonas sp. DNRA1]
MTVSLNSTHPIVHQISRIIELQKEPAFSDPDLVSSELFETSKNKLFAVIHTIHILLRNTPDELTSTFALNQISANLNSVINELTAFVSNKNAAHLGNVITTIEQSVIPYLSGFIPQFQQAPHEYLSEILSAQSVSAKESIKQLQKQRDDLAVTIESLTDKIAEQDARLETIVEGSVRERSESLSALSRLEQQFTIKENERSNIFTESIREWHAEFEKFEGVMKNRANEIITELNTHESNARKIVQVVGNIGVTGNYKQIANTESKAADFWRWATLAIFLLGISIAIATFIEYWGQPINANTTLSIVVRLLYAIAITTPAWYTARESARHRTNSDKARQTELELASLGPFIELMPPEIKIKIREQLTPLYFGKSVEGHTINNPLDIGALKDMLVEITKMGKS